MAYSFQRGLTLTERIAKNVRDMLEFEKGKVCYDRDMGVSTEWRHKNRTDFTGEMLTEASDMINERETRVHTTLSIEDGQIYANITEDNEND